MKLPFRSTLLVSALLLSPLSQANDSALEDTFKAFSQCDARFFSSLRSHAAAWQSFAPLKQTDDHAWITVKDRSSSATNSVALDKAPRLAGLKLLSYYDESSDLGTLGYYLYWGFLVDARPKQVAQQLTPLIADRDRLRQDGASYVRSEVSVGGRWQAMRTQSGQAPGTQRLERVLLIEPEGPKGDRTRVSCSLQGAVDGALLARMRPDIPAAEYPNRTPPTALDDVAVPEALRKGIDTPLLQPKFKSLRYIYVTQKANGKRETPVSVEMRAQDGLLRKTEIYSENFYVDRLTQADMIQLKSKLNGIGDGRVLVTQSLESSIPPGWILGRTLKAKQLMDYVPAKSGDQQAESELTCKIGQRFPAKQVFPSLTGDAIHLDCKQGSYSSSRAFVEELGIAFVLDSTSKSGKETNEVTVLEVVR
ncbi:hypothetical protein [Pseudomonas sp. NBRC 100443]|uniref:hypothetical protein n=1 Tax=Pseudomonas sp. NBRC 100443 TaxID=1113665 RepID=UPI00249FE03D|nr:hypothetical protein [Pseudomonas sp. NBRC 100443]GLU40073.1 hypothetical protein Pssp01_41660 [Pseudomonas sp. NBRC 100443]